MSRRTKNPYKSKKKHSILAVTTILVIVAVGLYSLLAWHQMDKMEKGILDVCAAQQDAYVQLVLDQINLKDNRDDDEIINEILSTLDTSSNKYWTFSKDRSMLFVKDVVETNRYKGLTTVSYYDSASAKDFLDSLQRDRVIHKNITVNDKDYVASGVAFGYNNDEYRLCLLTNKNVILNNNRFMTARVELILLVGFMLITLLAVSMLFAKKLESVSASVGEKDAEVRQLQRNVGYLNELLSQKEYYDTRYQLWSSDVIREFLGKLKIKNVKKVVAARIHCQNENFRNNFLERACVLLDKKVLRFVLGDTDIFLMYVHCDKDMARSGMGMLLNNGVRLESLEELDLDWINIEEYVKSLDAEE